MKFSKRNGHVAVLPVPQRFVGHGMYSSELLWPLLMVVLLLQPVILLSRLFFSYHGSPASLKLFKCALIFHRDLLG